MAHKTSASKTGGATPRSATAAELEQKVVALAEQMGQLIVTVQGKAEGSVDPNAVEMQLTRIRESAANVLTLLASAKESTSEGAPPNSKTSRKTSGEQGAATGTSRSTADRRARVDPAHAPGKKHRPPIPTASGVKHSDERIAKLRLADAIRRRRKH